VVSEGDCGDRAFASDAGRNVLYNATLKIEGGVDEKGVGVYLSSQLGKIDRSRYFLVRRHSRSCKRTKFTAESMENATLPLFVSISCEVAVLDSLSQIERPFPQTSLTSSLLGAPSARQFGSSRAVGMTCQKHLHT
jgi:hypothetical protein